MYFEGNRQFADRLKDIGYRQAMEAGISIAVGDLTPDVKENFGEAGAEVKEIEQQYYDGLITNGEIQ